MILKFNYIDEVLTVDSEQITSIVIENKQMLWRIVQDIYKIKKEGFSDSLTLYSKDYMELKNPKISVISDFFDMENQIKKYANDLVKITLQNLSDKQLNDLNTLYKKNNSLIEKIMNENEIPLEIELQPCEIILKNAKLKFKNYKELLNNLFQLIDIEKVLNIHNLIIFVGLKQYLTKEEITELYKYAIYNSMIIMLIDNHSEGVSLKNERMLIIDENLEEFMI